MQQMVIAVIGDDRAGLVDALSGAVAESGGNWEHSRLAELAGKFAGVVQISVPESGIESLTSRLEAIEIEGLLHVSMEEAKPTAAPQAEAEQRWTLSLIGADHTGIVHEISHALAEQKVSIEELETEVGPAPMGESLFQARAQLVAPAGVGLPGVQAALEALSHDLMVDLDVDESPTQ